MLLIPGTLGPILRDRPRDVQVWIGLARRVECNAEASSDHQLARVMDINIACLARLKRKIVPPRLLRNTGLESALHRITGEVIYATRHASVQESLRLLETEPGERLQIIPIHLPSNVD